MFTYWWKGLLFLKLIISIAQVEIIPNINAGGAGGFTRGMIECLDSTFDPTHILLMDDDILILPESIKRTYALLKLLKKEYQEHFIAGAMLKLEEKNIQHEDIGYFDSAEIACKSLKPPMDMLRWDSVFLNEDEYVTNHCHSAWWYCCIPFGFIRKDNLPLPLFMRLDDVEFSHRNKAKFISLNGIGVWHQAFEYRFNTTTEAYFLIRNLMLSQAISGVLPNADALKRIHTHFVRAVNSFAYGAAEIILDAFEDYCTGPQILMESDGDKILKKCASKLEKFVPLAELSEFEGPLPRATIHLGKTLGKFAKAVYDLTFNGHLLPRFCLKKYKVLPHIPSVFLQEAKAAQFLAHSVLVVNPYARTGFVRERSAQKFWRLLRRYCRLRRKYKREHTKIQAEYRKHASKFMSYDFWKEYLRLN
jgi:hypothetical protein